MAADYTVRPSDDGAISARCRVQAVAQRDELRPQRMQLVGRSPRGAEDLAWNRMRLVAQRPAFRRQSDPHLALVGGVAAPPHQPGRLETFQEWRQRAAIEMQLLADLLHRHVVA